MIKVCMDCRPGLRSVAGVALSHGYCRRHELAFYEREGLITPIEALQFRAIIAFPYICVALGALLIGIAGAAFLFPRGVAQELHRADVLKVHPEAEANPRRTP